MRSVVYKSSPFQEVQMKRFFLIVAGLAITHLALANEGGYPSLPTTESLSNTIVFVAGSTQKVCQLTGERDREFSIPTLSQTEKRYGLVGTDRGYSFEHNGKLFLLFGDSPSSPTFNGHPNGQTDPPRNPSDNDAIAFTTDTTGGACLKLDFVTDSLGAFKNPVVLNAQGSPAITLRTNETPIAGISDSGRMFVIFGTDNVLSNPPAGTSSPNGGATRSIVAVSDDSANTFHFLYNFSKGPGAKFIMSAIARGSDGYIYFWGTQGDTLFRKSPPFLARKPVGKMADSTAIEYLHSITPDGFPAFMTGEGNAAPLFHDSLPGPPGGMQIADCMGEIGVEWNPFVHRWVMLYNSSNDAPGNPRGIYMRFAPQPWGPWSAPQTIFNSTRDGGLCQFIHRAVTPSQPACDTLSGADRVGDAGGDYGPYFVSRFTTGDSAIGSSTFFFVMSTWNPYQVVLMKSSIRVLPEVDSGGIPKPAGMYVLNDASNEQPTTTGYAAGLTSSPAYLNDITGHAIFVPIAKTLPSISTWGQFEWDWRYLDTLVQIAVSHGKKFSIELETGYQNSSSYLHSLPDGFLVAAGANSAPLFDVWTTGGAAARGISAYIPLPWVPRVQEFWTALANALSAHLQQIGVYGSLTLVHVPGLSVYDEEIRLPSGSPAPTSSDTIHCPDGRPAYPAVLNDADTARWRSLGYSDSAVVGGFKTIAAAFAAAFPDRVLGLSLFPPGVKGIDFPNLTHDTVGTVASRIVKEVTAIAPGRVQLQADILDANVVLPEVLSLAGKYSDLIGWQSNKHGGPGAGCDGGGPGSCSPDGPDGPYFHLLQNGAVNGGKYVEVWSADVINHPQSFAAAANAGLYTLTGVNQSEPGIPLAYELKQNYPNPFNPSTRIEFSIAEKGFVNLSVYDILGRLVTSLVDQEMSPGSYTYTWGGESRVGTQVSSGVYFFRLKTGSYSAVRKMIMVR